MKNDTVVIAFTGKRGSGKNTAADALIEEGFVDIKFADPLKNMLRAFYRTCGVDDETAERKLEGDLKEVPCDWLNGATPRHAMQTLGTEWRDMISTTLWSDLFIKRVESGNFGKKIVCSDYRFPHEAEALNQLGATKVKVTRPGAKDDEASKHASETLIDVIPFDVEIENAGTIEELQQKVRDGAKLVLQWG